MAYARKIAQFLLLGAFYAGAVVSVTTSTDEGLTCFKIVTDNATYYFDKSGGGFSSIVDKNGHDWVGWSNSSDNWVVSRGVPNLMYQQSGGDYFHPGNSGCTSTLTASSSDSAKITSSSANGWECTWVFHPAYATFTLTKKPAGLTYWFLYEGTPDGSFNKDNTYYVTSGHKSRSVASQTFAGDLPSPEWVFFGAPGVRRVFFLAHHSDDSYSDQYYNGGDEMTVFGFGRQNPCCAMYLNAVPNIFSIGIYEDTVITKVSDYIGKVIAGTALTSVQVPLVSRQSTLESGETVPAIMYDIRGRAVVSSGPRSGMAAGRGVYFVKYQRGKHTETRKLIAE